MVTIVKKGTKNSPVSMRFLFLFGKPGCYPSLNVLGITLQLVQWKVFYLLHLVFACL